MRYFTAASRQRGVPPNTFHKIEIGGEISNAITTINTDYLTAMRTKNKREIGNNKPKVPVNGKYVAIRKLTPRECFRLQDVPDWMINKAIGLVSNSALYKLAGNSISVAPMEMTFEQLFYPKPQRGVQLTLF